MIASGAYFLAMFVIPVFGVIFNIGSVLGAVLSLLVILIGIFLNKIVLFIKSHSKTVKGKAFFGTVIGAAGVCAFALVMALGSISIYAKTKTEGQKTIIVLGCSVQGDTPSITLNSRINSAYDYLSDNPDSVAVLSGGQGPDENISEAQCMFNVLTEKGIDPKRLYMEDKSVNTTTNIENSVRVIEENNLSKEVAVASSDYHLKRATMICEKNGLKNVGRISAESTYYDKPTFYLREALGVVKEFIIR